jgi:hypothetical protein
MTFDPRTLPGKDFTFSLACMLWYGALLADCLTTRWGVWYSGLSEGNKIMKWFTDKNHVFRTFLDGAVIRPAVVFSFLSVCQWGGFVDKAHSYLPFGLAAATFYFAVKNFMAIRKAKKK